MKITIETNTNAKTPNQKLITPIKPFSNFLSLTPTIAFDNHPSARGLKKDENEENKKSNLNNNLIEKKNSKFKITLDSVDSKLYNNEVFFTQKDDMNNNNSCLSINSQPIKKQNNFTKEEEVFDNDITHLIKKRENSEIILNKFQKFANCKL
jgi:hypothetical protein